MIDQAVHFTLAMHTVVSWDSNVCASATLGIKDIVNLDVQKNRNYSFSEENRVNKKYGCV